MTQTLTRDQVAKDIYVRACARADGLAQFPPEELDRMFDAVADMSIRMADRFMTRISAED